MPKVPTYEPDQVSLSPLRTPTMGVPDVSSAGHAVAAGVATMGKLGMAVYIEGVQTNAKYNANKFSAEADALATEYQVKQQGPNALASSNEYKTKLKAIHDKYRPNGGAARYYDQNTTLLLDNTLNTMSRHELQEGYKVTVSTKASNAANHAEAAVAAADDKVDGLLQQMNEGIADLGQTLGDSPEETTRKQKTHYTQVINSRVKRMIDAGDTDVATRTLDKYGKGLTDPALEQDLRQAIDGKVIDTETYAAATALVDSASSTHSDALANGSYADLDKSVADAVASLPSTTVRDRQVKDAYKRHAETALMEKKVGVSTTQNKSLQDAKDTFDRTKKTDYNLVSRLSDAHREQYNVYARSGGARIYDNNVVQGFYARIATMSVKDANLLEGDIGKMSAHFTQADEIALRSALDHRLIKLGKESTPEQMEQANARTIMLGRLTKGTYDEQNKTQAANTINAEFVKWYTDKKRQGKPITVTEIEDFSHNITMTNTLRTLGDGSKDMTSIEMINAFNSDEIPQNITAQPTRQNMWSLDPQTPVFVAAEKTVRSWSMTGNTADEFKVRSIADDKIGPSGVKELQEKFERTYHRRMTTTELWDATVTQYKTTYKPPTAPIPIGAFALPGFAPTNKKQQ